MTETEESIASDLSSTRIEAGNAPLEYIDPPELSEWLLWLIGDGSCTAIRPKKGDEPNWFHRWMQRVAFGFRWERVKK
jgi:hypothetical protein